MLNTLDANKTFVSCPFLRSRHMFEIFTFWCWTHRPCSLQRGILLILTDRGKVEVLKCHTTDCAGSNDSLTSLKRVLDRFTREKKFVLRKIWVNILKNPEKSMIFSPFFWPFGLHIHSSFFLLLTDYPKRRFPRSSRSRTSPAAAPFFKLIRILMI